MADVNILREDFCEDIHTGDVVSITTLDGEVKGVVKKIRENSVKIENDESEPTVFFERMIQYEKLKGITSSTRQKQVSGGSLLSDATPYDVPFMGLLDDVYKNARKASLQVMGVEEMKKKMKQVAKRGEYKGKSAIDAIIDSLAYARKNHEDGRDTNKMHDIMAKINNILASNPQDKFARLLRACILQYWKDSNSAKEYAIAGEFESAAAVLPDVDPEKAAYAAECICQNASLAALWCVHSLSDQGQWAVYSKAFASKEMEETSTKNLISFAASCLARSGEALVWPNPLDFLAKENREYIISLVEKRSTDKQIIEKMEENRKKLYENQRVQRQMAKVSEDEWYEGKLAYYDPQKGYGFIKYNGSDTIFFYHLQVYKGDLRYLLSHDKWCEKRVKFKKGISDKNSQGPCADAIQLLDEHKEMKTMGNGRQHGVIAMYQRFDHYGKVQDETGKQYTFQSFNVLDPYLKAYIESIDVENEEWPVEFVIREQNGKYFATDIVSLRVFPAELVDEWKRSTIIRRKDKEAWERYKGSSTDSISFSSSDRDIGWEEGTYVPLRSFKKDLLFQQVPSVITKPLPKKIGSTKFEKIVVPLNAMGGNYYQEAHKYWFQQKYEKAEPLYIKAIENNDNVTGAIGDLLSLYIKIGNFPDAFSLMENQGNENLTREKYLNNMITLYSAYKQDPDRLLDYYCEAIVETEFPNRKLHYIQQKATWELNLGRYKEAMETCDVWKQQISLYSVTVHDTAKRYMERIKCFSLYGLGNKEEAKKMATSLLPFYPGNETLQEIVKGSLDVSLVKSKTMPVSIAAFDNLPSYLQNLIDTISLAEMKNTKYITDMDIKSDASENDLKSEYRTMTGAMGGASDAERARQRFLAAKYVKNCLAFWPTIHDESLSSPLTEAKMLENIRLGLEWRIKAEMGTIAPHIGTIRFYYLLTIASVLNLKDLDIESIQNSIVRYIETFFLNVKDMKENLDDKQRIEDLTFLIEECRIPFNKEEFRICFMQLIRQLKNAQAECQSSIKMLFNWLLNQRLFDIEEAINIKRQELGDTDKLFSLADEYHQEKQIIADMVDNKKADFGSSVWLDKIQHQLETIQLERQDKDYNKQVLVLLDLLKTLYTKDFEKHMQVLDKLKKDTLDLREKIESYPTNFSYITLLPMLEKMREWAIDEIIGMYKNVPNLSVEKEEANKTESSVTVVLKLTNQVGCQTADNPRMHIDVTPGCLRMESKPDLEPIGSQPRMSYLKFIVDDPSQLSHVNMIDLKVQIIYNYRIASSSSDDEDWETKETKAEKSLSVSLNDADFSVISNPFDGWAQGAAVTDENMMFGREKDIVDAIEKLCGGSDHLLPGRSIALYGQKRSGKTTLLHFVKERIQQKFKSEAICIHLGSMGSLKPGDDFLRGFLANVAVQLEMLCDDNEDLYRLAEENDLGEVSDKILSDENYTAVFERYMRRFQRVLKQWRKDVQLIFFLDEFTYIYNYILENKISTDILKFWKAFMETYLCSSVIVGQDSMEQLRHDYPNELGTINMQLVHYLSFDATREMLRKPLSEVAPKVSIEEKAYRKLYDYSAGSAYWHMILCSRLVAFLNQNTLYTITESVVENMVQYEIERGETITQQIFQPLYNDSLCTIDNNREQINLRLLSGIAKLSTEANPYVDIAEIKIDSLDEEEMQEKVDSLVKRKVLERSQGKYRIYVGLFTQWLNKSFGRD